MLQFLETLYHPRRYFREVELVHPFLIEIVVEVDASAKGSRFVRFQLVGIGGGRHDQNQLKKFLQGSVIVRGYELHQSGCIVLVKPEIFV